MKPINVFENQATEHVSESGLLDPFVSRRTSATPRASKGQKGYSLIDYETCPVCKEPMVDALLPATRETVKFCLTHRVTLPQPK